MAELRDKQIQQDSLRFRRNLERLGEIMAYEISKTLEYENVVLETVLGKANEIKLKQQPVLVAILRAALPFHQGFLHFFDRAENAFVGAFRAGRSGTDHDFKIEADYFACPDLEGKTVILIDPMLATGKSLVKTISCLEKYGKPAVIHVAVAIASETGLTHLQEEVPEARIWTCALDAELNERFYIVPGLGDAGDLAFGQKK